MKLSLSLFLLLCLIGTLSIAQSNHINTPDVSLKFGKGLQVIAADSSMSLTTRFRFQNLFTSERPLENGGQWQSNFLVRRARLKFDGWALSPNLGFKVELGLSNSDLKSGNDFIETSQAPKVILDAVVQWKMHKNWELWFGQAKLPGNRERVVSSQKLQFVDRSLVNSIFNLDREMGVHLRNKMELGPWVIRPIFAVSTGEGRNITSTNKGGLNYTGRLEFLPLGEFSGKGDYFEGDLYREEDPKLAVGASYSFNQGTSRQKQTGVFLQDSLGNYLSHNLETLFIDFIFKYRGFSIMGEYANKVVSDQPLASQDFQLRRHLVDHQGRSYYTGEGINVQASYLFKNNYEIAARYTTVNPDSDVSFTGAEEYTVALSKYIIGHNLKLQGDLSLINKDDSDSGKVRYRFQMEFAF